MVYLGGRRYEERKYDAAQLSYLEILNNLDIGIALFDAEGNYLFVNTELVNWAEYSYAGILEMNVHDF